jgi:hypothetical protein
MNMTVGSAFLGVAAGSTVALLGILGLGKDKVLKAWQPSGKAQPLLEVIKDFNLAKEKIAEHYPDTSKFVDGVKLGVDDINRLFRKDISGKPDDFKSVVSVVQESLEKGGKLIEETLGETHKRFAKNATTQISSMKAKVDAIRAESITDPSKMTSSAKEIFDTLHQSMDGASKFMDAGAKRVDNKIITNLSSAATMLKDSYKALDNKQKIGFGVGALITAGVVGVVGHYIQKGRRSHAERIEFERMQREQGQVPQGYSR